MIRNAETVLKAHFRNRLEELDKSWKAWGWGMSDKHWVIEVATRHGTATAMYNLCAEMADYTGQDIMFMRTLKEKSVTEKSVILKNWLKKENPRKPIIYQMVYRGRADA